MIDYTEVVADLTHKRAAIEQVLDGLHQLASGAAGGDGAAPPKRLSRGGGHAE